MGKNEPSWEEKFQLALWKGRGKRLDDTLAYETKLNEVLAKIDKIPSVDKQYNYIASHTKTIINNNEIHQNSIFEHAFRYYFPDLLNVLMKTKHSNDSDPLRQEYKKASQKILSLINTAGGYYEFYKANRIKLNRKIPLNEIPHINYLFKLMDKIEELESGTKNNATTLPNAVKKRNREQFKYLAAMSNDLRKCKKHGVLNYSTITALKKGEMLDFNNSKHDIISLFDHWGIEYKKNKVILDNCLFRGERLKNYEITNTRKNHSDSHTKDFIAKYLTN